MTTTEPHRNAAQCRRTLSRLSGVAGAVAAYVLVLRSTCIAAAPAPARAEPPPTAPVDATSRPPTAVHVHLPGIGGELWIDHEFEHGLADAHYDAKIEIIDWTAGNPGLNALLALDRNKDEAKRISEVITTTFRADPRTKITVSGHSGGAGLAVWAVEDLPADVRVDAVVLLAPALSPGYDLTAALRHVAGRVYVFWSPFDAVVLGTGTRTFGTIDRVHSDAMGRVGTTRPAGADDDLYDAKVVSIPYDPDWMRYGNIGDHIGPMVRPFARAVLAPLLVDGTLPPRSVPATRAATQPTTTMATRVP